jgi:protein farnesyltransferase/geranylgeranyltransferase type-1 subunit alpha
LFALFFFYRYFRRLCLVALGEAADWLAELQFCDDLALVQQKNYQVWHHRQTCVSHLGEGVRERDLSFCARMLEDDSKNYHVWSYRQAAVLRYGAFVEEEAFTRHMIEKDVRNNSAWNERFWVVGQLGWLQDPAACKREVEFALEKARKAPSNESPWLFIRGISRFHPVDIEQLQHLAAQWVLCIPVRALIVHLCEHQNRLDEALRVCRECEGQVDPIHAKFWKYKAAAIEKRR